MVHAQGEEAPPAVPNFAADAAAPAAEAPAAADAAAPAGTALAENPDAAPVKKQQSMFIQVIFGSGALGFILWLGLFGSGAAAIYFIVDCSILVKPQKIMAQTLIDKVTTAMSEGDVLKALKACESEPGPLANILVAGFSHVEEGFDIIQEAIGTAADIETERLMQRLNWISVMANIAPMLGLL
ncbi:MAG: MotA/TolQ/ExbB proton channel family protein, partial [Lentisphaerae bacterium]|nr:MotA/TolQ/ExbB proton channel family protein [Lentisphaerota bacterium]